MFGKNSIVGQKYFDNAKDKFFVTTIFGPTIQGEGILSGQVSMFIRLAKCNLACSFCDTYFDDGEWMTIEQIIDKIGKRWIEYYGAENNNIEGRDRGVPMTFDMACIITGGEPSLQKIYPLCVMLHQHFKYVQIESNGIIGTPLPEDTMLVVSPKCLEKNGKAVKYLQPNPQVLKRADALKFVISADPDSPYHEIPAWAHEWKKMGRPVYISPMNVYNKEPQATRAALVGKNNLSLDERSIINEVISFWEPGLLDMKANQANHEYARDYAVRHGLMTSLQQHLYLGAA